MKKSVFQRNASAALISICVPAQNDDPICFSISLYDAIDNLYGVLSDVIQYDSFRFK